MDLSFAVYMVHGIRAKEKQLHAQFQEYTTLTKIAYWLPLILHSLEHGKEKKNIQFLE